MTIKNRLGFCAAQAAIAAGIGTVMLSMAASSALAQGIEKTITLIATAPTVCTIDNPDDEDLFIDVVDGLPSTDTVSISTNLTCNAPTIVSLRSAWGGMVQTEVGTAILPAMVNFASRFNYVAHVRSGSDVLLTFDSATNPAFLDPENTPGQVAFDANSAHMDAPITLDITPALPEGGKLLMSGMFSDQIVMTISPTN